MGDKKKRIVAGICTYGDTEGLDRCLESLRVGRGGVDGAIVIHCRFKDFELVNDNSLQEANYLAKKYGPNVMIHHTDERLTEVEARNRYLQIAAEQGYRWLIVLDSDEFVARNSDWSLFREQLDYIDGLELDYQIYDIRFEGSIMESGPRPRLFLDPGSVQYWQRHYWFVLKKKSICLKGISDGGKVLEGIRLLHNKVIRTVDYFDASAQYQRRQYSMENMVSTQELESWTEQERQQKFQMLQQEIQRKKLEKQTDRERQMDEEYAVQTEKRDCVLSLSDVDLDLLVKCLELYANQNRELLSGRHNKTRAAKERKDQIVGIASQLLNHLYRAYDARPPPQPKLTKL